jgi:hypothetical protein
MLNIIALIVYMSFINIVYVGKLRLSGNHIKNNVAKDISLVPNNTKIRSKYCNFKCNCFFSHSVKNDNIYVPIWIKPLGL